MELSDYLAVVRKRWVSIALVALLVLGGAVAATVLATPVYTARSQVYVSVRTAATTADLLQGSSYTQRQVKSYTDLVTTPRVLQPVIEDLGLATSPDVLARSVSADSPLDTSLINIRVVDPDPDTAADAANALARSLASTVAELERPDEGPSPVQISTVRRATAPTAPSSPAPTRNAALGLLLGLALGFGLAVLREVLDTRVRTPDDIRAITDASVMTVMTDDDESAVHPLVVRDRPHAPNAEAIRRLRTNLQFLDVADRLETIVVTSSVPAEGKSTVAANLAVTLADAGARVVLVDADLRRPSIARYLDIEGGAGLTSVLIGQATIDDVVQPYATDRLHVLPAGQVPPNPSEMIGSRAMAWVLGELTKRYDVVVIDSPPLLPVTDAAILARLTGGALVVAGTHTLHRAQLTEALGSLEAVGAKALGIVANRVRRAPSDAYAYYGGSRQGTSRRARRWSRSRWGGTRRVAARGGARRPVPRAVPRPEPQPGYDRPTQPVAQPVTQPVAQAPAQAPTRVSARTFLPEQEAAPVHPTPEANWEPPVTVPPTLPRPNFTDEADAGQSFDALLESAAQEPPPRRPWPRRASN